MQYCYMSEINAKEKTETAEKKSRQKQAKRCVQMAMSYSKKEFVREIANKTCEIIKAYAFLFVSDRYICSYAISHWREALVDIIVKFQNMNTKPRRDDRDMVLEAVREVWITNMKLDTRPQTIIHEYFSGFADESVELKDEEHLEIAESFIGNMDELAREMAYGTYDSALDFVLSITPAEEYPYSQQPGSTFDHIYVSLNEFVKRAENIVFDLVRKWTVCKYYQMFDICSADFSGCMGELRDMIHDMKCLKIEDDADKYRVLYRMYVLELDFDDVNGVTFTAGHEFDQRGITDCFKITKTCAEFAAGIERLIAAVSYDEITIDAYMNAEFPAKSILTD